MANDVVWYHSDEVGAPTLNNAAGSLNDVLYACLVTGFRSQTLTSINVASNVATATLAGHGYTNDMMVDVAGATPAGLNGRKRITVTGPGTFTFPTTGVADGAATGRGAGHPDRPGFAEGRRRGLLRPGHGRAHGTAGVGGRGGCSRPATSVGIA